MSSGSDAMKAVTHALY